LLAPLESMHTFVTDSKADKNFVQALKKHEIHVIVA
jgi:DeoR/GlpR family transcriptional regulator of sugar metabolism